MTTIFYSYRDLRHNESFIRWANGTASDQEKQYWDRWVSADERNRGFARRVQQEIAGITIEARSSLSADTAFRTLAARIDQIDRGERQIQRSTTSKGPTLWVRHAVWFSRVAAALLLTLFTGYLVTNVYQDITEQEAVVEVQPQEVSTDFGEQKKLILPDGSEITLNGNTTLVYTIDPLNRSDIELHLDGEAYFNISRRGSDLDQPFLIQTDDGTIVVLGTSLSVSTRDRMTRVILEEGSVAVKSRYNNAETVMEPGQLSEFSSDHDSIETRFVNTEVYTSWTYGRLEFEGESLAGVLKRIEHTHGVGAVIEDESVFNQKLSGSIESYDLDIILTALSEMLGITIRVSEDDVIRIEADSGNELQKNS